ncbi:MATE family efflux transporter [Peptostreptococcaceae bacterium AGR-M142]
MSFNQEYKEQFKTYANPMILRSIFESLMHTADKLIAGIFIGSTALVATTLVSPLMFFLAAIARLFISGLGAYIGLLIGRNNIKKANQTASSILLFLLFLGIVLIIPPFFFSNEFVYLLGARGIFKDLAADYIKIFSLSFPFLLVGRGMDALILNDDSPKFSFVLNIITTSSNLIFNIIAVAVFDFGIKGLAFATVISCILEFLGGAYYFFNKSKYNKFSIFFLPYNRISYFNFKLSITNEHILYIYK